jgi:hypothetical protein
MGRSTAASRWRSASQTIRIPRASGAIINPNGIAAMIRTTPMSAASWVMVVSVVGDLGGMVRPPAPDHHRRASIPTDHERPARAA